MREKTMTNMAMNLCAVVGLNAAVAMAAPVTTIDAEPEMWKPDTDQPLKPAPIIEDFIIDHPVAEDPPRKLPPARGGFLIKDLNTGQTWESPGLPPTLSGSGQMHTGSRIDGAEPWSDRNFGTMSLANNPESFPANVNCRLTMTFTDSTGAQFSTGCSGTFIDPETVLTAAHCVYYGVRDGRTVNDFADTIVVHPATHQGVNNLGSCNATWIGAAVGYTDAAENNAWGDWDWDVAAIAVDRASGMLTGWHGLAWGGDCGPVLDKTYHNFAYPGEPCGGTDGAGNPLHNFQDMYYWSGTFDSCFTSTQLQMDTPNPNCFNTSWGGMSGSSAYYIDGGTRYCLAVCSNAPDDNTHARYGKLWTEIAEWIFDEVMPIARGEDLDLQALDMNQNGAKQIAVDAYDLITDLSFRSANPTNGSAPSTDWPLSVHLSANDFISATDTLLMDSNFNWTFDAMSSVNVTPINVRIPVNTPTGDYFIGSIVDDSSVTSNNATHGWDAIEVAVTAVSEIEALAITPLTSELDNGETFYAELFLRNNGAATALDIDLAIYLSLDETISNDDLFIGEVTHGSDILGGETSTSEISFPAPEEVVGQSWYLCLKITHAPDVILTNNTVASLWAVDGVDRPSNDYACLPQTIGDGLTAFDTTWAITDGQEHEQCEYDGQTYNDVWFKYVAPISGTLVVTTCEDLGGSADYDTDIVVYGPDPSCSSLQTPLGCNDDDPVNPCGNSPDYHSTVTVETEAGGTYYIRVGGYSAGDVGTGSLLVDVRPFNDDCQEADIIGLGDTAFSTVQATTDGPAHPDDCETAGDGGVTVDDIWYVFTPDCSGTFTASTCNQADYDTDLVLYTGDCGDLTLVACNDDSPNCTGYSSILEAQVEANTVYLLRVGGYDIGEQGSGVITTDLDCTPPSKGDVDGDGDTDIDDLLLLISYWGTNNPSGDLNNDGIVDVNDLLILLGVFDG